MTFLLSCWANQKLRIGSTVWKYHSSAVLKCVLIKLSVSGTWLYGSAATGIMAVGDLDML